MRRLVKTLVLLAALIPFFAAAPVYADISKQEAASIAQTRFSGRVIGIQSDEQNGTPVYRVKVLDKSGGLHLVVIDRQNGNILSAH
jgi:uncharacterized membrane protein YkoI